jgi:hypothetical protein
VSDLPAFARAWLQQRQSGHAAVAAVEAAELRRLTDADAIRYADALLAAVPPMTPADSRWSTSGLVEQQQQFARARR